MVRPARAQDDLADRAPGWSSRDLARRAAASSSDCLRSAGSDGSVRRRRRAGLALQDPAEPEQLVLDLVEGVVPLLGGEQRLGGDSSAASTRSAGRDQGDRTSTSTTAAALGRHPVAEQAAEQLGPLVGTDRRVGDDPAQPRLAREQVHDGEQLAGQPAQLVGADVGGELVHPRPTRPPRDCLLIPRISGRPPWRRGPEVVEEPVDDAALARVVVQRLADDPLGQLGGQPTEVGAQRRDDLLPLGRELLLAALADPARTPPRPSRAARR